MRFICFLFRSFPFVKCDHFQAVANVRGVSVEDEAYRGRDEDLDLEKGSQVQHWTHFQDRINLKSLTVRSEYWTCQDLSVHQMVQIFNTVQKPD